MDDNKFDEYMLKLFDRVFDKLEKLSTYMDELNKTLVENTSHLEYHIKRTDQNEEAIKEIKSTFLKIEERFSQELIVIRANGQKHEENDILRFEELKNDMSQTLDSKFETVLPLVQTICEDIKDKKLKAEIKAEDRAEAKAKFLFWLKVIGGISTIVGLVVTLKAL